MTNKKKTFFNKLLLATSSIGLLASAESFAVDIVAARPTVYTWDGNDWQYNGAHYNPQNSDNIILTENNQRLNIDTDINIGILIFTVILHGGL